MFDKAKEYFKKISRKNRLREELHQKQEEINKEYVEKGPSDEIIQRQIEINKLRNANNIPDTREFIYEDYVQ